MRKILIVGASQAGLHLAHGLLDYGYDVTLMTSRDSKETWDFETPLLGFSLPRADAAEASRGLNFWDATAPRIDNVHMSFRPDSSDPIEFTGQLSTPFSMIDTRVKRSYWLDYFEDEIKGHAGRKEKRAGKLVIRGVTTQELEYFAKMFDLVVVAVGGGELGQFFDPEPSRLAGTPRVVTQVLIEDEHASAEPVRVITAPYGEIFATPVLTQHGIARGVFFASAPGGPLDCSEEGRPPGPSLVLDRMRKKVTSQAPDVVEWLDGDLVDGRSVTTRRVTPVVRRPVGALPNGGKVLGIGDVLCRSDPITGREISDETLAAEIYLEAIIEHGDRPFDEAVINSIFERYYKSNGWASARFSELVRTWWDGETPEHVMALLGAAQQHQMVANQYVESFDNPGNFIDLLENPEKAYALLNTL